MKTTAMFKIVCAVGLLAGSAGASAQAMPDVTCIEVGNPAEVYSMKRNGAAQTLKIGNDVCQAKMDDGKAKVVVKAGKYLHVAFDCGIDKKAKLDIVREKVGSLSRGTVFFRKKTEGDEASTILDAWALECKGL